jgi:hypothetical protein
MTNISWWKKAWVGWKSFAHKLGNFQARVILTILYFVMIAPFSLIVRFFSDPLSLKKATAKGWIERADNKSADKNISTEIERAAEQF